MLVKVIFHGVLKKLCPDEYKVEAETAAEAIRGVTNQLRKKLVRKDGTMFQVVCKQCLTRFAFFSHIPESEEIFELDLYPAFVPSGGGNANTWMIIVGAVIMVAAIFFTGGLAAFASFGALGSTIAGMAGTWGGFFLTLGAGMVVSGLVNILTQQSMKEITSDSVESSRTFGVNTNTTKIGTRIPIGYGKYKICGHYLSVNTQTVDRSMLWDNWIWGDTPYDPEKPPTNKWDNPNTPEHEGSPS